MNSIVDNVHADLLSVTSPYRKLLMSPLIQDFSSALESELFIEFDSAKIAFLVTSPNQGEGKTLTALAAAILPSLHTNCKTLLIDASHDFSSLCALGMVPDRQKNLSVEMDNEALMKAVRKTSFSHVDICQVYSPTLPTYFLPYQKLVSLYQSVAMKYDRIVVDSVAASVSSDYLSLAKIIGHAVIVTEHRKTRRHQLESQLERLRKTDCQIIGSLLNRRKYAIPKWLYGK